MGKSVTVKTAAPASGMWLCDDGKLHKAGDVVSLTDKEFANMSAVFISTYLTVGATVADPQRIGGGILFNPMDVAALDARYATFGLLTDIAGPGVKAVGASTRYADAAHVHPREMSVGGYFPADYGYTAWNYDPANIGGGVILTAAGTVMGTRLWLPTMTVTNIIMLVTTIGNTLTNSFVGLFNDATNPVLLSASADQSAAWAISGVKTMALSTNGGAQAITAGFYNIAVYSATAVTLPTFGRYTNTSPGSMNLSLASPHMRAYTADTGRTTTFASPMGAQTAIPQLLWCAVS